MIILKQALITLIAVTTCLACESSGDEMSEETTGDADTSGDGDGDPTGDGDGDPAGDGDGDPGELICEDALILDLSLQEKVAEGAVSSTEDGDDWLSSVDASAGGTMAAAMNPWVYMRFGDAGLEKVEIDDYAALSSDAWDIAAKRFGIRANSGNSGPGMVGVAAAAGSYADVDVAPDPSSFAIEDFYTDDCVLIEDMSGLPGNPAYAMANWWGYAGCVTTSNQVFVLSLPDDRMVKLTVEAYYAEGQAACNENGTMGSGSAEMTWRWRFLE
ncbi:HmuY family protein [Enhygromyxa salina]|uniref:Uncharacterized protein n=1 Tax=Enhygromyxa salina TaxID=215803 RepID=A0A2S9XPQ0_9BACT|nr:HmuY family protein [Enhygromyxa salina]PRP94836.1 hypothetical protein ENSA7_76590 [Enhygromyxa salina]